MSLHGGATVPGGFVSPIDVIVVTGNWLSAAK
jgi:hypothetical protein